MPLLYLRTLVAFGILSLTACTQHSNLHQIQHEIKALNQNMVDLSQQAVILSEQNALNAQSTQGAYLLPNAQAPVLLESQIGTLEISLSHIADVAGGTQITLLIKENTQQPLPDFSGMMAWETLTDKPDQLSAMTEKNQSFQYAAQLTTPDETAVTLLIPDLHADHLRWIRIHDIQPNKSNVTLPSG